LSEGEVFKGKVITVRVVDGHEIVEHAVGVAIAAVDDEGRVLLVRQMRKAVGRALLELPAGLRDGDESGPATAQRELGEETGLEASLLERLAEVYTSPGFTDEVLEIYFASGLAPVLERHADPGESIDEVVTMPLEDAYALCISGEINDAKTIVGLTLARERLRAKSPA
jgi:ADP-ribose pyrophosphatase